MYALTQFGTVTIPPYSVIGDMPTAPSRPAFLETVRGVFDAAARSHEALQHLPYTLTVDGKALGTTAADVRGQLDALRAMRGVRAKLYREDPDGNQQWCWARLDQLDAPIDPAFGPNAQEFNLDFLVADLWRGGTVTVAGTLEALGEPFSTIALTNEGNRGVHTAVITITASLAGPVSGLDVTAYSTGDPDMTASWGFAGTVAAGSSLVVDCENWTVLCNGTAAYQPFRLRDAHTARSWLPILPPSTSLQLGRTAGTPSYEIVYSHGWE